MQLMGNHFRSSAFLVIGHQVLFDACPSIILSTRAGGKGGLGRNRTHVFRWSEMIYHQVHTTIKLKTVTISWGPSAILATTQARAMNGSISLFCRVMPRVLEEYRVCIYTVLSITRKQFYGFIMGFLIGPFRDPRKKLKKTFTRKPCWNSGFGRPWLREKQ